MRRSTSAPASPPRAADERNMPAHLFAIFERNAERTLLIDARSEETWTYGRMLHESRILASLLVEKGIKAGDAVVFSMDNCAELAALYLACMHIKRRPCLINPSYHPRRLRCHHRQSAAYVISSTSPTVYANVQDAAEEEVLTQVFCIKPTVRAAAKQASAWPGESGLCRRDQERPTVSAHLRPGL